MISSIFSFALGRDTEVESRKPISPKVRIFDFAFPMSARVIEKLGQEADPRNHLLMQATGANVSGQIASVVAGGVILQYCAVHMIGG